MSSMQCYIEEGKEFDYYGYGNQKPTTYGYGNQKPTTYGYGNQKPTTYSSSGYEQSYYEKDNCYETKPEMMGYGHQHGSNPCGPMMGHGKLGHGGMGYGMGHNGTHGGMGYTTGHNGPHGGMGYGTGHNMHKPGSNGLGMGLSLGSNTPLGHVMGFGKKHEGHGSYGMGSSGCPTYKKQHRRRRGYGSDCSDSSDDERRC